MPSSPVGARSIVEHWPDQIEFGDRKSAAARCRSCRCSSPDAPDPTQQQLDAIEATFARYGGFATARVVARYWYGYPCSPRSSSERLPGCRERQRRGGGVIRTPPQEHQTHRRSTMATLDPQPYLDEHDACEYHEAGLQLVAALLAKLDELEARVEALEAARARLRRRGERVALPPSPVVRVGVICSAIGRLFGGGPGLLGAVPVRWRLTLAVEPMIRPENTRWGRASERPAVAAFQPLAAGVARAALGAGRHLSVPKTTMIER